MKTYITKYTIKELAEMSETHKPGVKAAALVHTEEELGAEFPKQYRTLVKITNSPLFGNWVFIPIKDPNNLAKTELDIVYANTKKRPKLLPPDYVAFADRGTKDLLCFKITDGAMEDAIYFHQHEAKKPQKIAQDLEETLSAIVANQQ